MTKESFFSINNNVTVSGFAFLKTLFVNLSERERNHKEEEWQAKGKKQAPC